MTDSSLLALPDAHTLRRCIIDGERSGRSAPPQGGPGTIAFASLSSLTAVLSEGNRRLLHMLGELQPSSLTELSEYSGRKVPSLSRTLRMMEGYGLVRLERVGASIRPSALATRFVVILD